MAHVLEGEVQGGSVSYDIVDGDGKRWEVKEPGADGSIRPGNEGRAAIADAKQQLERASRKLVQGLSIVSSEIDINAMLSQESQDLIRNFIASDISMIKKGEISKGRIERMYNILKVINNIIVDEQDEINQKKVELGDEDHSVKRDVDLRTYVRLGQFLKLSKDDLRVEDAEVFAAAFNYDAFLDPDDFIRRVWREAAKASDVFGHTAGVILVHPDGFRIVAKEDLDTVFQFNNISQGTSKFKIARS
ncbi:MAG: hypothetical protein ACW96N_06140 [Candidatus Thorarchaeota archaeon]